MNFIIKLSIIVLLFSISLKTMALISQTVPISPTNSKKYGIQVIIKKLDRKSKALNIKVSGNDSSIGSHIFVFQLKSAINLPKEPILGIGYEWPDKQTPTKKVSINKSLIRRGWSATFKVPKSNADKTYLFMPPDKNVADGVTFILDLPAFVSISTNN